MSAEKQGQLSNIVTSPTPEDINSEANNSDLLISSHVDDENSEFSNPDEYVGLIKLNTGVTDQNDFDNILRKEHQDHEHKLALLKLQHEQEKFRHEQKMAEIEKEIKKDKVNSVLESWQGMQKEERKLRKMVSIFLLIITSLLALGSLAMLCFIALGMMQISTDSKWVVEAFFGTVFAAMSAMTHTLVKGLFPAKKEDTLSEINKIVEKL